MNLATQDRLGGAQSDYVQQCFQSIADHFSDLGISSLAIPRIEAGLGTLEYNDITALLEKILGPLPIPIIIYETYQPGVEADEF